MNDIRAAIAAERRDLAAVLAGLSPEQWDEPTLCAGWRVREVVAHLTMAFRYSLPKVGLGILMARGDFNKAADRFARRDAGKMTPEQLTTSLSRNANHPWKPPVGGYEGALAHDLIHGLDITVPLGLDRKVPEDRLRPVLPGEPSDRSVAFFGVDLDGVEFRADDLDWTFGAGTPVHGSAQDLLLAICGRKLPPGRLLGAPAARFTRT
ncbi:maleylpyruvate isomerase family mycothiol-dependent enzyme [Nonomuraea sp. NPDC049152]|uniref:maleylpyruvate isomerase family mycothiol-dependent enzyme n=1 Tax=Nonomuraea sp. NPDC049152 TaxID=3154350 RepID=UPI0033E6C053